MILGVLSQSAKLGGTPVRLAINLSRWISSNDNPGGSELAAPNPEQKIDRSRLPQLDERDLEEKFISGSGPGGQCVNKSVNCCQLRHKPTGLIVKVHQSRGLDANRKIARELLVMKLDNLMNGENSIESQKRRIGLNKIAARKAEQERRRKLKEQWRSTANNSGSACQEGEST